MDNALLAPLETAMAADLSRLHEDAATSFLVRFDQRQGVLAPPSASADRDRSCLPYTAIPSFITMRKKKPFESFPGTHSNSSPCWPSRKIGSERRRHEGVYRRMRSATARPILGGPPAPASPHCDNTGGRRTAGLPCVLLSDGHRLMRQKEVAHLANGPCE